MEQNAGESWDFGMDFFLAIGPLEAENHSVAKKKHLNQTFIFGFNIWVFGSAVMYSKDNGDENYQPQLSNEE